MLVECSADRVGVGLGHDEHAEEVRQGRVVGKPRVVQAHLMFLRGGFLSRQVLPPAHRERALVAKLEDTRAGIPAIADLLRTLSALEDRQAHLTLKATRERRGGAWGCKPKSHKIPLS